ARFRKSLDLRNVKIGGAVDIYGTAFDEDLKADALQVGSNFMVGGDEQNPATLHSLWLNKAKINGDLQVVGVPADGPLMAMAAQIVGSLWLGVPTDQARKEWEKLTGSLVGPATAKFNDVFLIGARADGNVWMNGSYRRIEAAGFHVTGGMSMQESKLLDEVDLHMARIGDNLDLRSAHVGAPIYLSGATIAGDLQLGGGKNSHVWDPQGSLHLRNAHIGNLMDARDGWPQQGQLHVQGFPFGHLGGISGNTGREMRSRGKEFWDGWARLDPDYSPLTYSQLATVFI